MPFHGHTILLVVGLGFSLSPFIGKLRRLPRLIRFALVMSGVSLVLGGMIGLVLDQVRPQLSRQAQFFIYSNEIVIFGIGLGVLLLLIFSGEMFKALRALDAERKRHVSKA